MSNDSVALLASAFGDQAQLPVALAESERAYLTGLLAGLRTSPPDGDVPLVPSHAPLSPTSRAWIDGVLAGVYSRLPLAATGTPVVITGTGGDDASASGSDQRTVRVVWSSQTGTVEEYIPTLTAALGAGAVAGVLLAGPLARARRPLRMVTLAALATGALGARGQMLLALAACATAPPICMEMPP